MKKILLLLALCTGTGKLMAQNTKPLVPFDNTLNGKLSQPFKIDSSWLKLSNIPSNLSLLKQEPIDLKNIIDNKVQQSRAIANSGDKMPVAKLDGYSKMPVVVLEGNSKMPVVGKALKQENRIQVNP